MPLFDVYLVVDWSASSSASRGKDSIWVGSASREGPALDVSTTNLPTRAEAAAAVDAILRKQVGRGRSVLVGFDFPYGYPAGFAAAVSPQSEHVPPWLRTWHLLQQHIQDDAKNRNNRFEVAALLNEACHLPAGPFWGCPSNRASDRLRITCHSWQTSTLRQFRHTDQRLRDRKLHVQEVWKLWGAGSVGSQALLGIPRVASLRFAAGLAEISRVWPFETGFGPNPIGSRRAAILHCEIWPGVVPLEQMANRVRDDLQVETLARHFAELDAGGELARLFDRPIGLSDHAAAECTEEEGWILGA